MSFAAQSALAVPGINTINTADFIIRSEGAIIIDTDVILGTTTEGRGADIIIEAPVVVVKPGVLLRAGDGRHGKPATSTLGYAQGEDGHRGGDIIITAAQVEFHGQAHAGNGGNGGDAHATGPTATAIGGNGARAGRTVGIPHGNPGTPGNGGTAIATGTPGEACGSDGASVYKHGRGGTPTSRDGETVNATAGRGANGCSPGEDGGDGGDAWAFGGDAEGTGETPGQAGDAYAYGGNGGNGADACTPDVPRAGNGGKGGDAYAHGGNISYGVSIHSGSGGTGDGYGFSGSGGHGGNSTHTPGNGGEPGTGHVYGGNGYGVSLGDGAPGGGGTGISGSWGDSGDRCQDVLPAGTARALPFPLWPVVLGFVLASIRRAPRAHRRSP